MPSLNCPPLPSDGRSKLRATTRQRILDAAEELVLEEGPAGLRTKDLVARSGVSERTIFNHFESIEATALARIEDYLIPLFCDLEIPADAPVGQLPAIVRQQLLANLSDAAGQEQLAGFIRLAAALASSSGEVLTRHVLITLTGMGRAAADRAEAQHPELSMDDRLALRLFTNNLAIATAFGLARGALTLLPGDEAEEPGGVEEMLSHLPDVATFVPHITWAYDQVSAGAPQL
ncbi:TetR/AcrR family transcriptional regulator [Kocuria sp.]|uniref:TetR/AcrR family transcriptional regulator n=1 Tax=Kocuria sp. TaxID=1871328 RepID=UPI0026DC13D6|nr:TetR/AcrR family transcriptional regulator [Kocuria sp.]MDO4918969.1 TetR/AcrR family transcriptional regulator [Kocuria sp.]